MHMRRKIRIKKYDHKIKNSILSLELMFNRLSVIRNSEILLMNYEK